MITVYNKEIVSRMYQTILNQKQFDQSSQFIDNGYLEEFSNANKPLFRAFPDILEYQKIPATHKKTTIERICINEQRNGKIINSTAKPDKLSLLQLGIIPNDFINY